MMFALITPGVEFQVIMQHPTLICYAGDGEVYWLGFLPLIWEVPGSILVWCRTSLDKIFCLHCLYQPRCKMDTWNCWGNYTCGSAVLRLMWLLSVTDRFTNIYYHYTSYQWMNYNAWHSVCIRYLLLRRVSLWQSLRLSRTAFILKVCIQFEYVSKPA